MSDKAEAWAESGDLEAVITGKGGLVTKYSPPLFVARIGQTRWKMSAAVVGQRERLGFV